MAADAAAGAGFRLGAPYPLYHAPSTLISLSNPPTVAFCNVAADLRVQHPLFSTHCKSEPLISQPAHFRLQHPLRTPQAAIDASLVPESRPKAAHSTLFYIQGRRYVNGVAITGVLGSHNLPCLAPSRQRGSVLAWRATAMILVNGRRRRRVMIVAAMAGACLLPASLAVVFNSAVFMAPAMAATIFNYEGNTGEQVAEAARPGQPAGGRYWEAFTAIKELIPREERWRQPYPTPASTGPCRVTTPP